MSAYNIETIFYLIRKLIVLDNHEWTAIASCREDTPDDYQTDGTFVRSANAGFGVRSAAGGQGRRKREVVEKVCCKESNVKPSCSELSDTHR